MVLEIWSMSDRIFVILDYFLPFYPNNTGDQNFEKMKQLSGDMMALHMCRYHKWQSYDVARYEVRQTKFFCHFGLFLALLPD